MMTPFVPATQENTHLSCFLPETVQEHAQLIRFTAEKGELLYQQGQNVRGLWFLVSGMVGLYNVPENGKDTLVRVCHQGGWFGFISLFGNGTCHCSARVMHEAQLYHVIPHDPVTFLQHYPAFQQFLVQLLAGALADSEHRMTWIARHRTRERLLGSLWYLTQDFPDYEWTWREVAEFAGCETETALRFSKEIRRAGILDDTRRRLHVRYPDKLAALLN